MAADYKKLKEGIASAIKSNGAGEITGDILQEQMLNVVDTLNEGKAEAADLADIKADVAKLKVMVETGTGGGSGGEGGGGLIIVDDKETLEALEVPQGTVASVVIGTEIEKPLSELYDYIAEGGDPLGNDVPYSALDIITDFAFTFPNLPSWPTGNVVLGSKSGGPNAVFNIQVDAQYVRLFYVVEGKANVIILAEKNGTSHTVYDDAVIEAHSFLRAIPDICYYGVDGAAAEMEQFLSAIITEAIADAYILGETWQRLIKDGEMPEIDLSALAKKTELDALTEAVAANKTSAEAGIASVNARVDEVIAGYSTKAEVSAAIEALTAEVVDNEEVTAAALNDLNERVRAIPTSIDAELSEISTNPVQNKAITTKLNEKQDALVSGTSIKTINGQSLLGEGNLEVVTDLSAMATKAELQDLSDVVTNAKAELQGSLESLITEIVTNEEVTAAALNDLNDRVNAIIARLDALSA